LLTSINYLRLLDFVMKNYLLIVKISSIY